eukprot:TRINITY_DN11060_c0_g1_i2.p1 TRINITY_DN11060_c0_g1~~TRINITY_DN11060_c0_g1_i2.p1  ORF type:complete len:674 (+),score=84.57 TRINITY_DN11060_c0_g1_i2:198-2219(+)
MFALTRLRASAVTQSPRWLSATREQRTALALGAFHFSVWRQSRFWWPCPQNMAPLAAADFASSTHYERLCRILTSIDSSYLLEVPLHELPGPPVRPRRLIPLTFPEIEILRRRSTHNILHESLSCMWAPISDAFSLHTMASGSIAHEEGTSLSPACNTKHIKQRAPVCKAPPAVPFSIRHYLAGALLVSAEFSSAGVFVPCGRLHPSALALLCCAFRTGHIVYDPTPRHQQEELIQPMAWPTVCAALLPTSACAWDSVAQSLAFLLPPAGGLNAEQVEPANRKGRWGVKDKMPPRSVATEYRAPADKASLSSEAVGRLIVEFPMKGDARTSGISEFLDALRVSRTMISPSSLETSHENAVEYQGWEELGARPRTLREGSDARMDVSSAASGGSGVRFRNVRFSSSAGVLPQADSIHRPHTRRRVLAHAHSNEASVTPVAVSLALAGTDKMVAQAIAPSTPLSDIDRHLQDLWDDFYSIGDDHLSKIDAEILLGDKHSDDEGVDEDPRLLPKPVSKRRRPAAVGAARVSQSLAGSIFPRPTFQPTLKVPSLESLLPADALERLEKQGKISAKLTRRGVFPDEALLPKLPEKKDRFVAVAPPSIPRPRKGRPPSRGVAWGPLTTPRPLPMASESLRGFVPQLMAARENERLRSKAAREAAREAARKGMESAGAQP